MISTSSARLTRQPALLSGLKEYSIGQVAATASLPARFGARGLCMNADWRFDKNELNSIILVARGRSALSTSQSHLGPRIAPKPYLSTLTIWTIWTTSRTTKNKGACVNLNFSFGFVLFFFRLI